MFSKKSKKSLLNIWKRLLGWSSISILMLGGLSGVAASGYYMSQDANLGSDFGSGTSFDIQLSLDETLTKEQNNQAIQDSAVALENILNNLGLSQVLVNSGTTTINNNQTGGISKKFGVLSASFDTSNEIFGLLDIDEKNNEIINNFKIYSQALNTYNVELENISTEYPNTKTRPTGRTNGINGVILDETTPVNSYFLNDDKNYKSLNVHDGKYFTTENELIDIGEAVQIELPTNKDFFATSNFIKDKNDFNESIVPPEPPPTERYKSSKVGEEPDPEPPPPDLTDAYQTSQSWMLWKDKSSFINKLNNLTYASLYNLYANGGRTDIGESSMSDQRWFIDLEANAKINRYLQTLNDVERLFVEFVGDLVYFDLIVTEANLMTILYDFYNSEVFAPNNSYKVDIASGTPSNKQYSTSIINGWYFLESDNTDLSSLFGTSLYGMIDYRNYKNYFFDDNNVVIQNADEPILEFNDNSIRIKPNSKVDSINISPTTLRNKLIETRIPIDYGNYSRNLVLLFDEYQAINAWSGPIYKPDTDTQILTDEANQRKEKISNLFSSNTLLSFSGSNISTLGLTFIGLSAFDFFIFSLIILILTIGIIISVLYRFPGFISFIMGASAFGFSILFFNLFGLTFNFYVYAALFVAAFINFFIPLLLFKNVKKEVKQGSMIAPAFQKSMFKYSKMFVDIYIVEIIIALSFFFFATSQISSFGAMLVVNALVSLLINYVLLYLLLIILIRVYSSKINFLFASKRTLSINDHINSEALSSNTIVNLEDSKFKNLIRSKHFFTIKLFNKRNMFIAAFPFVIAIVGFILFFALPNGVAGFNGQTTVGSTLVINNFNIIGWTPQEILKMLNLEEASFFLNIDNDQMIIGIGSNYIIPTINNPLLTNNLNIFDLNFVANENLLASISNGIFFSMLFLIVWSVISLNIISVIPILIINIFSTGISLLLSWLLINLIGVESMAFVSIIYVLNSILSFIIVSSLKSSWNRKKGVSHESLKDIVTQITARLKPTLIIWNTILLSFTLLMAAFGTANLVVGFLLVFINSIIIYLISLYILPQLWYMFVILRDKYQNEINNISSKKIRPSSYDVVDEQNIKGINHH